MVDTERRRSYKYNRILIDKARILDPQFSDALVYLTGAQVELLRNVSHYLDRLDTYVETYEPGYYLVPNVADYDEILAIVADMKEVLMGNPNTIWGYQDQHTEWYGGTKSGDGQYSKLGVAVPAGYVDVITKLYLRNETGARGQAYVEVSDSIRYHKIVYSTGLAQGEMLPWSGHLVVKTGQRVRAIIDDCLDGDVIDGGWMGYRMKLPE